MSVCCCLMPWQAAIANKNDEEYVAVQIGGKFDVSGRILKYSYLLLYFNIMSIIVIVVLIYCYSCSK